MRAVLSLIIVAGVAAIATSPAHAQMRPPTSARRSATSLARPADPPPAVQREFRGVWVASVSNIDWPSRPGLPADSQQTELLAILDRSVALGLNAVVLQVRPAADALYWSKLEPWSEYLTGAQGRPPEPFYDPLAFAVREAHARGLELHAWFNPYRGRHPSAKSPEDSLHLSRRRPTLVRSYGRHLWLDPGEPAVRRHSLAVVLDVVRRYDVDGVHIDDYFYPYKERDSSGALIEFPDSVSYARYRRGGGRLARDDWRRRNVDQFVQEMYESVKRAKPWVKVGVSPFGIWRPGSPPGIAGLDAYEQLFADSRTWLRRGWVDYFTPQLYWPISAPAQSYPVLLEWWVKENVRRREIWPGNFTSRVGATGTVSWRADELIEQIRLTRAQPGARGNVHFSMRALMGDRDSLSTRLASLYAEPALIPVIGGAGTAPARPVVRYRAQSGELTFRPSGTSTPSRWLVQIRTDSGWRTSILPGAARALPIGADTVRGAVVRQVSRRGVLSAPVRVRVATVAATGTARDGIATP